MELRDVGLSWCELLIKLCQDAFAVPLRRLCNRAYIVVNDEWDVLLMAFLVVGLVNADIHKPVQSAGVFGLDYV